jgi:hypothetical protein
MFSGVRQDFMFEHKALLKKHFRDLFKTKHIFLYKPRKNLLYS